jgi:multiple sugar transport system ATP-binding protein
LLRSSKKTPPTQSFCNPSEDYHFEDTIHTALVESRAYLKGYNEIMAGITFEHVYKQFGDVSVLKDLDFKINDQEFLVLVGPSGCGKSTALRCLAGLEEITDGTIYIGDRVVNDLHPKERDIAMVFQSYALYPHMTVYDNMAFSLRLRSKSSFLLKNKDVEAEIDRRIREAAAILDIAHLLDRKPKALSGGQRQRVALGRAIVRDPAVFLMDEPLSNLDAKLRVQTRAEISKLHQRLKTTFIYVTHDQTEAMTMGTRIAVMWEGILQQIDTPQSLYDEPANKFVAGFIGSPAMNFFERAQLERGDNGMVVHVPGVCTLPVPPHKAEVLDRYLGTAVTFGIRPENVHDPSYVPSGVGTTARITATVGVTERMGSEIYVYLERKGVEFIGRFDPRSTVQTGDSIEAVVDMNKMHIFDQESEKALV